MIRKILTQNDTGQTGTHQAGILVPKNSEILDFFPKLDSTIKNPRVSIQFTDNAGDKWYFNFIYYNNKFFGGTRNEFRLTGMTGYFKAKNIMAGDEIHFSKNEEIYVLNYLKVNSSEKRNIIKLTKTWITIKI
jgi:hypothetical protein